MRRALPIVLLAASCATARPGRQDPDAEACHAGVPAACASRGLRALTGEGVPRDERDAAAWLMAACEAQSCADLGALYAAGRGVRRDDGRACDLGLADACVRAGRPLPEVARAPSMTLGPEAGPERPLPPDPVDRQTLPPAFAGVDGRTTVRYKVNPDGRASGFLLLQPAPIPIARSIRQAVYGCQFVPAADEEGTPVTMWVIQPVRFVAR